MRPPDNPSDPSGARGATPGTEVGVTARTVRFSSRIALDERSARLPMSWLAEGGDANTGRMR